MGCFKTLFPFGKGDAAMTDASEDEPLNGTLAPQLSAQEPPADAQQAVEIGEPREEFLTPGGHPEEQELAHCPWHSHHPCQTTCCKCCSCCDNCCDRDGCCGCCNCHHHCGLGILCCLPFLACRAICRCCCCCCSDSATVQEATIVETTTAVATAVATPEPATEPVIEPVIGSVIETVAEPVTGVLPAVSSASETEPLLTKSSVVRTITA